MSWKNYVKCINLLEEIRKEILNNIYSKFSDIQYIPDIYIGVEYDLYFNGNTYELVKVTNADKNYIQNTNEKEKFFKYLEHNKDYIINKYSKIFIKNFSKYKKSNIEIIYKRLLYSDFIKEQNIICEMNDCLDKYENEYKRIIFKVNGIEIYKKSFYWFSTYDVVDSVNQMLEEIEANYANNILDIYNQLKKQEKINFINLITNLKTIKKTSLEKSLNDLLEEALEDNELRDLIISKIMFLKMEK